MNDQDWGIWRTKTLYCISCCSDLGSEINISNAHSILVTLQNFSPLWSLMWLWGAQLYLRRNQRRNCYVCFFWTALVTLQTIVQRPIQHEFNYNGTLYQFIRDSCFTFSLADKYLNTSIFGMHSFVFDNLYSSILCVSIGQKCSQKVAITALDSLAFCTFVYFSWYHCGDNYDSDSSTSICRSCL